MNSLSVWRNRIKYRIRITYLLPLLVLLSPAFGEMAHASSGPNIPSVAPPSNRTSDVELVNVPPSWDGRLIYYQNFSRKDGSPVYNSADLLSNDAVSSVPGGIFGDCGAPGEAISLHGEALSPSNPLVISFWWKLTSPPNDQSGFNLVSLTGQGLVSAFVRSGPWCGLTQPAAVCQIYYFKGIKDVNGIYDNAILEHLDLKPGVWHHTLMMITAASRVQVWTDGVKVFETRTVGRNFLPADNVVNLEIGDKGACGVALAEIAILNRPLSPSEITEYYQAFRQIQEAEER